MKTTDLTLIEQLKISKRDIAARYGGDEFCVILTESSIAEAQQLCQRQWRIVQPRCRHLHP